MVLTNLIKVGKVLMSLVALVLGALAGAAVMGQVQISPAGVSFLEAAAGALTTFGFQPPVLSAQTARVLGVLAILISASHGLHGAWPAFTTLMLAHPHLMLAGNIVGLAGIVMGFLARNPVPSNAKFVAKLDREALGVDDTPTPNIHPAP